MAGGIDRRIEDELALYRSRTERSRAAWERSLQTMPLGVPTSLQYFAPYPLCLSEGAGSHVRDLDGNEYHDFHLGYSVMVCGHAHPAIEQALASQIGRGVHFGFLTEEASALCEELVLRFGLEQVQLTNSGTEATSLAGRIARAATGRAGLIKVEGGYHGTTEALMTSTHPSLREAGPSARPAAVPWGHGSAPGALADTRVVSFNDLEALERLIAEQRPAAVIVEPVLLNVGFIAPAADYLASVRRLCADQNVVMILDEVKSGLTLAWGGARERYGIEADLVCLGKGIGGGLAAGAVGGRADLLATVSDGDAPHYATFAGNPLAAAAGRAALREVLVPDAYRRQEPHSRRLLEGIQERLGAAGIDGYAIGTGLKGTVVLAPGRPFRNYRDFETRTDADLTFLYWLVMVNRGILLSPGQDEQWTTSVVHGSQDIDAFLTAFDDFCTLAAS